MKERYSSKKNNQTFTIIASIWLFFSCVFIINAFNTWIAYNTLNWGSSDISGKNLGQKMTQIQNTLEANKSIQKQEYEKALQLISWDTSEDYYNRGTIQTLLAYQNWLKNTISWLDSAQIFIAQAQQNFDIAKKLAKSETIKTAIMDNQTTVTSVSTVVDIKTCYGLGQGIITDIKDITTIINGIKNILNQEDIYIKKRASSLGTMCYEKLRNIADASKEQVGLLQLEMQRNNTKYTSEFYQKIENPLLCIDTPYENILSSMDKGRQWLQTYQQQHINTVEALKINSTQSIKELCEQSKNDAEINQQIEDSVQELLQKLNDNKMENQTQKKSTNEVKYKDFFDENEKKILEEIQQTNHSRINTILDIRGKGNYDPERYINDMFNQFYGNSGDFIDLHK